MEKITIRIGRYDDAEKNMVFIGELLKTQQEFDAPNDTSRGTQYALYRVPNGYRVYQKRWINGQGRKRKNYAKLSQVLSKAELLEKFSLLANYAGITETEDGDSAEPSAKSEKTVLLAANANGSRLLPYTLANVEELIDLAHVLSVKEDLPAMVQGEIRTVLEKLEN